MKYIKNEGTVHSQNSTPRLSLIKTSLALLLILTSLLPIAKGQDVKYGAPVWIFGAAGGANINFYNGSTQKLNADITAPIPFTSGTGIGLYIAPLVEYHFPESKWAVMMQAGYDSRKGTYAEVISPCNCPKDLSTDISYITLEPTAKFAPINNNGFYLFGGPRVAFNVMNEFTYQQKNNPDMPNQEPIADVKGNLSDMYPVLISVQIGAGYDIPLSSSAKQMKYILSPFVSFQPYFGQSPRSIETWDVTTLRAGLAVKMGRGMADKSSPPPAK